MVAHSKTRRLCVNFDASEAMASTTFTAVTNAQLQSPFFSRLPAEVRIIIYSHVFVRDEAMYRLSSTPVILGRKIPELIVTRHHKSGGHHVTAFRLVCKLVREESQAVYLGMYLSNGVCGFIETIRRYLEMRTPVDVRKIEHELGSKPVMPLDTVNISNISGTFNDDGNGYKTIDCVRLFLALKCRHDPRLKARDKGKDHDDCHESATYFLEVFRNVFPGLEIEWFDWSVVEKYSAKHMADVLLTYKDN